MPDTYEAPGYSGEHIQDLRIFLLSVALAHPQTRTGDYGTRIADILLEPMRPKLLQGMAFADDQKRYSFYTMREDPQVLEYNSGTIAQLSMRDDEISEGHIVLNVDGSVYYDETSEDGTSICNGVIDDRRAWFLSQKLKTIFPDIELEP